MADLIRAQTISEEGCQSLIKLLRDRFDDYGAEGPHAGSPALKLHSRIRWRREHYHNLPEADPVLAPPYDKGPQFQSDILRRTHVKFKARCTANHFVWRVNPSRDLASERSAADDFEIVLNEGTQFVESRERISLQGGLIDGLSKDAYGIIHWRMLHHLLPEDDLEEMQELPPEPKEDDNSREAEKVREIRSRFLRHGPGFREKGESFRKRHSENTAMAGFPWYFEVIDPASFYFVEDRSLANGMAVCMMIREVGLLDYNERLHRNGVQVEPGELKLSLREIEGDLPVWQERNAPMLESPSGAQWGRRLAVAEIWLRNEYYELAIDLGETGRLSTYGNDWTLIQSTEHPYEMPPFAIAPGNVIEYEADPALRYEPLMEGLYRVKPFYDRHMALQHVIAEQIALPKYYLRRVVDGAALMEDGEVVYLTQQSAMARKIPDGYELAKVEFDLNEAFVHSGELWRQELFEAAPGVGEADVTASTQPWSIRLQQAQASVEPGAAMRSATEALQVMGRNMARTMSKSGDDGGFGEAIYVYATDEKKHRSTVGVEPEDIRTLNVDVDVNATSEAEQVTKIEHGASLRERGHISRREFIEDYRGLPNLDEVIVAQDAEELWETLVKPSVLRQELVRVFGRRVRLGPDFEFVGPDGQQVQPEQVLQENGVQIQQGMQPGTGALGGGQQPPAQQTTIPGLPGINTPGTVPLGGLRG